MKKGKTLQDVAIEVIRGEWGDGAARKEALEKAGYNYKDVQDLVYDYYFLDQSNGQFK